MTLNRGKWTFKQSGEVKQEGEEEAKLPSTEPVEVKYVEKGKWGMGENGKLVPYVEKPKPTGIQIKIDITDKPIISNIDGSVYYSKKAYRRHLQDHGHIEVGDQIAALHKSFEKTDPFQDKDYQKQLEEDIEKSRNEVIWGDAALTEEDKEYCRRQNEAIKNGG